MAVAEKYFPFQTEAEAYLYARNARFSIDEIEKTAARKDNPDSVFRLVPRRDEFFWVRDRK